MSANERYDSDTTYISSKLRICSGVIIFAKEVSRGEVETVGVSGSELTGGSLAKFCIASMGADQSIGSLLANSQRRSVEGILDWNVTFGLGR
jgi:hypothetical protein